MMYYCAVLVGNDYSIYSQFTLILVSSQFWKVVLYYLYLWSRDFVLYYSIIVLITRENNNFLQSLVEQGESN